MLPKLERIKEKETGLFFDVHLGRERSARYWIIQFKDTLRVRSALRNGLDKSYVSCIYGCDGMHAKGVLYPSSVHCPLTARRGLDVSP